MYVLSSLAVAPQTAAHPYVLAAAPLLQPAAPLLLLLLQPQPQLLHSVWRVPPHGETIMGCPQTPKLALALAPPPPTHTPSPPAHL